MKTSFLPKQQQNIFKAFCPSLDLKRGQIKKVFRENQNKTHQSVIFFDLTSSQRPGRKFCCYLRRNDVSTKPFRFLMTFDTYPKPTVQMFSSGFPKPKTPQLIQPYESYKQNYIVELFCQAFSGIFSSSAGRFASRSLV